MTTIGDNCLDAHRRSDRYRCCRFGPRIKEHVGGVVFEGCRLVRLLDPVREPLSATLNWKHFSKADVDVAVFQDVCTRRPDDHPLQTRLKELAARFPKAKDITEALQATPTYCKAGAVQWCRTMRKTGDKWEVAYYDGCTEKRATSDDLRLEASSAPKEAGRSQLDARSLPMNACAAAHQLGYEWSFDSPVPLESCHGPEDEVALLERISEHRWRLVGEEEAARFKMGPRMTDLSTAVAGVLGPTWQRVGDTEAQRIARGHGLSDVFAAYVPRERRRSAATEFVVLRASRRLAFDDSFESAATKSEPDVLCSEAGLSAVAGSVRRYDVDRKALWCEGAVTTPRGREGRVSVWQHDGWHVVLLDGYARDPAAARRVFGRAFQKWSERASNVYAVTQTSGYPRTEPASWLRGGWMNLKWGMGPGDMFSRMKVSASGSILERKSTDKKLAQVFTFPIADEIYDERVKAKTSFFGGRLAVIELCPAGTPDTNALRWYSDLKGGLTEKYGPPADAWVSDDNEKCYGVQWFAGQTRVELSHCPTLHKNIPVCVTYTDLSLGRDHSKERNKL